MDINVEYKDQNGNYNYRVESINYYGILKHLAIAGQYYLPSVKQYIKIAGNFLRFSEYLEETTFNNSHFSEPPSYEETLLRRLTFLILWVKA
jgi:hypothetical protein